MIFYIRLLVDIPTILAAYRDEDCQTPGGL